MLATGDQFPDFELGDYEGELRSLADYQGSWLVLFAFPGSGKSCENQARSFEGRYNEFKDLGVEVVGLSPQSQKRLANLVKKHDLSYTLLSDPDNELLGALEVWGKKKMAGKTVESVIRSTFLVNPEGKIAQVWENIKVAGHADAVLEGVTEAISTSEEQPDDTDDEETKDVEKEEREEETDELEGEEDEHEDGTEEDDIEEDDIEEDDTDDDEADEESEAEESDEPEDERDDEEEEKPETTRKRSSASSQRSDDDDH